MKLVFVEARSTKDFLPLSLIPRIRDIGKTAKKISDFLFVFFAIADMITYPWKMVGERRSIMKTNGYELREAVRRWQLRADTAEQRTRGGVARFPNDPTPPVAQFMEDFWSASTAVATLQAAQVAYNLQLMVGERTLAEAIKLLGAAGKREKLWRKALAPGELRDRYVSTSRRGDEVSMVPTVDPHEAMSHATDAAAFSSALRAGIAQANGTTVEVNIDPELLRE